MANFILEQEDSGALLKYYCFINHLWLELPIVKKMMLKQRVKWAAGVHVIKSRPSRGSCLYLVTKL